MNELALFAGAGGGILGGKLLWWRTVCAVERDAYAAAVLAQRQNDGCLDPFPIWSDVETFDGQPWRGIIDVVSGGFPCQDISCAGKGKGITGERSGLWGQMARIVRDVRPRFVFVENSPMLTSRGLGTVLADLAEMGYDAEWCVLGACDAGAPHKRDRMWILAHAQPARLEGLGANSREPSISESGNDGPSFPEREHFNTNGHRRKVSEEPLADAARVQQGREIERAERERIGAGGESNNVGYSYGIDRRAGTGGEKTPQAMFAGWWLTEPGLGRVAHGVADRVDRLKAIGNGQVPQVAAMALRIMWERLERTEGER